MKNCLALLCIASSCLFTTQKCFSQVVINEICATNSSGFVDDFGNNSDWIELYNAGSSSVNLNGYGLSDDPSTPLKWTFSSTSISAGGYLIIVADDSSKKSGGGNLHCKFKLSKTGETVALANSSGTIIDQKAYPSMSIDNSYGRSPNGGNSWCIFKTPTAKTSNNSSTCYSGYASIPLFSVAAGFYSTSKSLTLTTVQSGGVIRYTRNGTDPTSSSTQYSGAINLDTTQVIRAKVFANNVLPSPTITNTYFIKETTRLPIVSITTTPANLWDYNTGIYVTGPNASSSFPYKGANYWQDWEKPATIEFFDKDRNRAFRFDAGIKINGGYSRAKPQKSFEILMADKYDLSNIDYPLIPNKSFITKWDDWVIRNAGSDWMEAHLRDAALERGLKNTNASYIADEPCLGFVNGQFFGIYYLHENDDHNFVKNNYGYKKDEIDLLVQNDGSVEVRQGSKTAYNAMYSYATTSSPTGSSYYSTMNGMFDLLNFTDYFAAEIYYGNCDWIGDWTNNIKLWRPRISGGKFRYITYDMDQSAGLNVSSSDNSLVRARRPNSANQFSAVFDKLLNNQQFKEYFINRYADLMNTNFLPANLIATKNNFKDSINADMPRAQAKYGISSSNWTSEISSYTSYVNGRPSKARGHVQAEFALAGQVTLTLNVSPAGAGYIIISTISPGTYPWSGVYFNGNPVTITAVPNAGYSFNYWKSTVAFPTNNTNQTVTKNFTASDNVTAYFTGSAATPKLTVGEINYNSSNTADAGDWIEFWNYSTSAALNISGWYFKDENDNHKYTFPVGTVLPPDGRLVLAQDITKFKSRFPSVTNVQSIDFGFENGGEFLRIYKHNNSLYLSFTYANDAPWPTTPDGQGYTLELSSATGDLEDGNNWYAGCPGGSPGTAFNSSGCCSITANITAGGSTTFCQGLNVTLTATSGSGYTYKWKKDGVTISGATSKTYSANSSGSYTCVISSGNCSQTSSAIVVTVNPSPTATITPNGTVTFCSGGHVTLNANTGSGLTYKWKLNGSTISGATSASYTANASGSYTVVVSNGNCTATSSATVATMITIPSATITPDSSIVICTGTSLTLSANTGSGFIYQWKLNGSNISGANYSTYAASVAASYVVVVTNSCGSTTSSATAITISGPVITPTATAGGSTSFCGATGGSVMLSVTPASSGYTFQWKKNGSNISGAISKTYSAVSSGTYTCEVFNRNCSGISNTISVNANTAVTAGISPLSITKCAAEEVLLYASPTGTGYTYKWYKNNSVIGTTGPIHTSNTSSTANYKVTVTSSCGSSTSPTATITVNCREDGSSLAEGFEQVFDFRVYPNPFNSFINLELGNSISEPASVRILDVLGKEVFSIQHVSPNETIRFGELLKGGIYFVEITYGETKKMTRIVKVK